MKKHIWIAMALFLSCGWVGATEYNLTTDFSTNTNPNGVWSYGAMEDGFTNFTVSPWYAAWGAWTETEDQANVWINESGVTEYGIPDGSVALHPGIVSPAVPAVIRWTAPSDIGSAVIQISGAFGAGDTGLPGVSVRQGTNSLWSTTNAGTFNETVSVVPGDTIDFCVYGESSYGNTALGATIAVASSTPYISEPPVSVYTDVGDLVTFSVAASASSGTVSYVWIKDSLLLQDNEFVTGANYSRLVISPTRLADAGDYQVVVSDDAGSVTSSVVTLTLDLPLPAITAEPADTTVTSGASAQFTLTASDAVSYQWYCGETAITNSGPFSGATTSTLQINPTHQTNNAVYSVWATNARGTIKSRAARLTVTASSPLGTALDNNSVLISNPGAWGSQPTYTHDGVDAARSKSITHNQSTEMNAILYGPGEMNFQWYASSEGPDRLTYYFDNSSQAYVSGTSGGWASASRFIPEKVHEIAWRYSKDGSINTGLDAGFVDQLVFAPYLLSSVDEAVDGLPGPLTFGGAGYWYGQTNTTHEGIDAARAPSIGQSQSAWFETTVMGPGRIVFWTKTSSEGPDRMQFRVDGTSVYSLSGASDWQASTNWIDWGEHTLRWGYEKDNSINSLDDTVWIDQISYTPVIRTPLSEAADDSWMVWTTDPSAPWFGQDHFTDDGIDALQSGDIGDSRESWVKAVVEGPGTISFRWKSHSESPDYIRFYINGTQKSSKSGYNDWSDYSIAVPEGQDVELMWKFTKDSSSSHGEDAVWIDKVVFEPQRDPVVLTVAPSTHGTPSPASGTYTNDYGTTVAFSVSDVISGSTQYECTGWKGTGSVPASGTSNAVEVTLSEHSSITWNWQTNYWLDVNTTGSGSLDVADGWYAQGSEQILTATPDAGWLFMSWSGDASGTNEAFVTMSGPQTVMATFSDDADGDGLTNTEEAGLGSNPWNSDTDGDGFPDLFEANNGLSPTYDNTAAVDFIRDNGGDFNLYASNVVLDVAMGEILLDIVGNEASLNLQLKTSDDLVTWTNSGLPKVWSWTVGEEKKFFRVRSEK